MIYEACARIATLSCGCSSICGYLHILIVIGMNIHAKSDAKNDSCGKTAKDRVPVIRSVNHTTRSFAHFIFLDRLVIDNIRFREIGLQG